MTFLSEENLLKHKEFVEKIRLKYSIMKKSIKGLENLNIRDISRQNMKKEDKRDALFLLGEICAHERFFSSFGKVAYQRSRSIEAVWGSTSAFLNAIYKEALGNLYGYTALCLVKGRLKTFSSDFGYELFLAGEPLLVIDVCEHAFFSDYGFDKEGYLYRALPYLDLTGVDKFFPDACN